MTNQDEIENKNEPWYLNEYIISFFVIIIVFFLSKLIESELKDIVLHILIAIAFGSISFSILTLIKIRKENQDENRRIIDIIINKIEQKIYRKLVSTNAIISNRDDKLSLTARILNDFPNLDDIKKSQPAINPNNSESIDLVRMLSYQNLILTPKYLDYFFYRKDSVKDATRIVVLDKDQLNGKICQATLTYLFLSVRYGYRTFIIPELRFKLFLNNYCKIDGKSKAEREKQEEVIRMIKGNPFILKLNNGINDFSGEYTDFQTGIDTYGEKVAFSNKKEYWDLLNKLIENSVEIHANSTGFEDDIRTKIINISNSKLA